MSIIFHTIVEFEKKTDEHLYQIITTEIFNGPMASKLNVLSKYVKVSNSNGQEFKIAELYADCDKKANGVQCDSRNKLFNSETNCLESLLNQKGLSSDCKSKF